MNPSEKSSKTEPPPSRAPLRFSTPSLSHVPFNRAAPTGKELQHIKDAIRNMHISGDGPFTERCSLFLEEELGVAKALLTTSCTHALEICAHLLNLEPGDEVIVPSFTFVSTANAFALRRARPVFCDIRSDTLNMDETKLASLVTPRTRAIVPVHYAGVGCEMDAIMEVANRHGIPVVEDNAHGLFGEYRGRALGTFGELATLSFHETKNFSCGEGGALLVNHPAHVARAEILREKGTNRSRFMRGEVQKYTWVDIGSSYLPSDLLAAFLFGQLEQKSGIQETRKAVWEEYETSLADWAAANSIRLPVIPAHCLQAYHMFYLIMPDAAARDRFIDHMLRKKVKTVFHYLPLHLSEVGRSLGGKEGDCPVTEDLSARIVRLPFFTTLSDAEQNRVIEAALEFSA